MVPICWYLHTLGYGYQTICSYSLNDHFSFQQGDDTYLARQNSGDESHGVSLHVLECFKRNITGKGIRITVLDDGLEHSHQDIKESYVSLLYGL